MSANGWRPAHVPASVRKVAAIGAGLALLVGAALWLERPGPGPVGPSEPTGCLAPPSTEGPTLRARPGAPPGAASPASAAPSRKEPAAARAPNITPRLELVDADTGLAVSTPEGLRLSISMQELPGQRQFEGVAIHDPPAGYVAADHRGWSVPASPDVEAYRAVYPLRREAHVTARFNLPQDVGDAKSLSVTWWIASVSSVNALELPPSTRETSLRGVPFLPGETLRVQATLVRAALPDAAHERMPVAPVETEEVGVVIPILHAAAVVLPRDARSHVEVAVDVPPLPPQGETLTVFVHVETDNDLPYEESFGESEAGPTPKGGVVVRYRRLDGTLANDVSIRQTAGSPQTTDETGTARFSGLPPARVLFIATAPGAVPVSGVVEVTADTTQELELAEPVGATVHVEVVDVEGHPLPFAEVHLKQASDVPYLDVEDRVQRIDPFTDVQGRRTFRRVEPGRVLVRGSFGSRSAHAEVHVPDGGSASLRIVLGST